MCLLRAAPREIASRSWRCVCRHASAWAHAGTCVCLLAELKDLFESCLHLVCRDGLCEHVLVSYRFGLMAARGLICASCGVKGGPLRMEVHSSMATRTRWQVAQYTPNIAVEFYSDLRASRLTAMCTDAAFICTYTMDLSVLRVQLLGINRYDTMRH